ncbi:hypothetical protein [Lentzea sp. NPDC060358]|uniref:hypothetical protein n=1 Tax=Lentzea sp. NPDC060358 TaxID=3347103 RepID=UPI0036676CBF
MEDQGEPHLTRLFAPGVAVLLGFVLLAGNPWLDLAAAIDDSDSFLRVATVLVSYPNWQVDVDRAGPFLFWFWNLRTVLFVVLTALGLSAARNWVGAAGGRGRFVVTVGVTALGATVAGLVSGLVAVTLLDTREALPLIVPGRPEDFFLVQFSTSAAFGVLFGSVLGAVVAVQRAAPAERERRAGEPKSLW